MAHRMARANRGGDDLSTDDPLANARTRGAIRDFLRALFDAALAAADPARAIAPFLPTPVAGRTVVVGGGKAAAAMARAFEAHWRGPLEGLVVTRRGHA